MEEEEEGARRSYIHPIYVFSVKGLAPTLLLDTGSLVAASYHGALVLQPVGSDPEQPYRVDTGHDIEGFALQYDVSELKLMLVEAVAKMFGGLAPPTEFQETHYEKLVGPVKSQVSTKRLWA